MLESEALKIVCHRTLSAAHGVHRFANCLGSGCMLWQDTTEIRSINNNTDTERVGQDKGYCLDVLKKM